MLFDEGTRYFKSIKKSIMAAQKMEKYIVVGSIKGFLIIC